MTPAQLEHKVSIIERKVDTIDRKVDKIYDAVAGNAALGVDGIVGKQTEQEKGLIDLNRLVGQNYKHHEGKINGIQEKAFKRGVIMSTTSTGIGAAVGITGWVVGKPWLVKLLVALGFLSKEYMSK